MFGLRRTGEHPVVQPLSLGSLLQCQVSAAGLAPTPARLFCAIQFFFQLAAGPATELADGSVTPFVAGLAAAPIALPRRD